MALISSDQKPCRRQLNVKVWAVIIPRNGPERNGTVPSHYFTERIWNGLPTTHAPCSGLSQFDTSPPFVLSRLRVEMSVQVFQNSTSPLPISEIAGILRAPPEEKLSTLPPCRPKAGEIYIYSSVNNPVLKGLLHYISNHIILNI